MDCQPILDKMLRRIKSWSARKLSYGGCLILIKSVLNSFVVYWGSILIIPKMLIKKVESDLNAFLWSGVEMKSTNTKVSWCEVCKPMKEGGLGLQNLKLWNKALSIRHIWDIYHKKDTLWIQWIHFYLLKNESFWAIQSKTNCSWC